MSASKDVGKREPCALVVALQRGRLLQTVLWEALWNSFK